MALSFIPIWKEAPFIRLLLPFVGGILLQWQTAIQAELLWGLLVGAIFSLIFFQSRKLFFRFRYYWISGFLINLLVCASACLIYNYHDLSNQPDSIVLQYRKATTVRVKLEEPLVEKENSLKALASVQSFIRNDSIIPVRGNLILYFEKDTTARQLQYGSSLIFIKPLQAIKRSGNPGAFDYKRYCALQNIYYQVYLKRGDFQTIAGTKTDIFQEFLFSVKQKVLGNLSKHIPGEKESGFAKALLIGYKDDLDKDLVQSYSKTGVVHIIAISGLHLGIIYWLLSLLMKPLQNNSRLRWISALLILGGLWAFSLLAGAGPSVLRSAFMFSLIVFGRTISKNSSVYNNLAASAFILLCIDPFWIWDVGFQLSYAAVLSILVFFKPVYNWFYFENKIVDVIWKMCAVTIAAQILTMPIAIYHFHQFPVYFLLANLVAVPVSSIILLGEILLCCFSFLLPVAAVIGNILHWMIGLLNLYIRDVERLPFAVWDNLQISISQFFLLLLIIIALGCWFLQKHKTGLFIALICSLVFFLFRSSSFYEAGRQTKIIVYNVPNKQAIDFISGRACVFRGDTSLLADPFLLNFHLKPVRILNRIMEKKQIKNFIQSYTLSWFCGMHVLIVDHNLQIPAIQKIRIDLMILSANVKIDLPALITAFRPKWIVADASNKTEKIKYWRTTCDSMSVPFHDVTIQGAFVLNQR